MSMTKDKNSFRISERHITRYFIGHMFYRFLQLLFWFLRYTPSKSVHGRLNVFDLYINIMKCQYQLIKGVNNQGEGGWNLCEMIIPRG